MPQLERLTPEEVDALTTRRTPKIDLSEYTDFLTAMRPGDWGRITLNGESQRTVKRRLTTAGKQMGVGIRYSTRGREEGRLLFHVKP
jgi:hypothetical protein